MKLNWRKILVLILTAFTCLSCLNKAYAGADLNIAKLGSPYNSGNNTIQDILLSLKTKNNWKLLVTSLNNGLSTTSHPSSQIPVSRLSIQDSSSLNTYQVQYNKPVIIGSGTNNENIDARYSIKISNSDTSYPGIYTGSLLFTLVSSNGTSEENFILSFTQNPIQDISITPNTLDINVDARSSMLANYSQESSTPVRIYVRSNQKWKLVLQGTDQNNSLNYAFKVLSVTNNAKLYYNSDYTPLVNNNLTIAEGDSTVSADGSSLDTAVIEVNYRLTTGESSGITAGSYPYNLIYSLSSS